MKSKFILFILFFVTGYINCQDNYTWRQGFRKIIDTDTLYYKLQNDYFYVNVPNLIKLDSKSGDIKDFSIQNGKYRKLENNIYEVYPDKLGEIIINITTLNVFKIKHIVTSLPKPKLSLMNSTYPELIIKNRSSGALYLGDLSEYYLSANWNDYNFKILGFNLLTIIKGFVKVEKSNSNKFNVAQLELIQQVFQNQRNLAKIYIENIKTIGPDSVIRYDNFSFWFRGYDNFIDAFINNRSFGLPLQNYLRIKLTGNPTSLDIQNLKKTINELDQLTKCIDVKIVKYFPNMILNFDSIGKYSFSNESKEIIFFPSHKKTIIKNLLLEPEQCRSSIITGLLVKELLEFYDPFNEQSIYSFDFNHPENCNLTTLTQFDKRVLQLAFSKEGYKKLTKKNFRKYKKEFPGKLLLTILISLFILIISIEVARSYKIFSVIKNTFLKYTISYLFISQFVILVMLIIYGTSILSVEKQLIPFSILVGWQLFIVDKTLKKIKINWISLLLETFGTITVLEISYHIVFLFTMGEFNFLQIYSESTYLILVSIVLVRILIRYQFIKMNQVIKEKDLKISLQNELLVKSQLSELQARINPHFLYNSLNSLAELAKTNADKTEKMALSLSQLFQYSTNRDDTHTTTLSEEIRMVELYLSVEKQRFADKLEYAVKLDDNLKNYVIPKFLLQPIVENAVKHGISKITQKGQIKIEITEEENKINIKIFDNGPDFPKGLINGYGLQNTYDKLNLIYEKPFEIRFVNGDNKHFWLLLNK